jgi:hypothetical protein
MVLSTNTIVWSVIFALVIGLVIFVEYYERNKSDDPERSSNKNNKNINASLTKIFYLYDHESEREWLSWMMTKDFETQKIACNHITNHLEDQPKHWGYITLEALECLKEFKNFQADHHVGKFLLNTSKLWGEYKSIPNYYQKAASVLAYLNDNYALTLFKNELAKSSNIIANQEKKKIIINTLIEMNGAAVPLLAGIITNPHEILEIRIYALHQVPKLSQKSQKKLVIEATKILISQYSNSSLKLNLEELQLVEDIFKELIRHSASVEVFNLINQAAQIEQLQEHLIAQIIKYVGSVSEFGNEIKEEELYAFSRLNDNSKDSLKKILAKKQKLSDDELNEIILVKTSPNISESKLIHSNIYQDCLPIFDGILGFINAIHELLSTINPECAKSSGGLILTGDANLEKIYYLKALAKRQDWQFDYINCQRIKDSSSFQDAVNTIDELRKPFLLYLNNPQALLEKGEKIENELKKDFIKILEENCSDAKAHLVGNIPVPKEFMDYTIKENYTQLQNLFFGQEAEINEADEALKLKILEGLLKHINLNHFENRIELSNEIMELGKSLNLIEFSFFSIETFKTMLLVFGKNVPYYEIERLEKKFKPKIPSQS